MVIPQFPAKQNPRVMQNPTQEELTAYFTQMAPQVTKKIVIVGKPTFIDQSTDPAPKHIPDAVIKCRVDPTKTPADCAALAGGPQNNRGGGPGGPSVTPRPNALTNVQLRDQIDKFLVDNNV